MRWTPAVFLLTLAGTAAGQRDAISAARAKALLEASYRDHVSWFDRPVSYRVRWTDSSGELRGITDWLIDGPPGEWRRRYVRRRPDGDAVRLVIERDGLRYEVAQTGDGWDARITKAAKYPTDTGDPIQSYFATLGGMTWDRALSRYRPMEAWTADGGSELHVLMPMVASLPERVRAGRTFFGFLCWEGVWRRWPDGLVLSEVRAIGSEKVLRGREWVPSSRLPGERPFVILDTIEAVCMERQSFTELRYAYGCLFPLEHTIETPDGGGRYSIDLSTLKAVEGDLTDLLEFAPPAEMGPVGRVVDVTRREIRYFEPPVGDPMTAVAEAAHRVRQLAGRASTGPRHPWLIGFGLLCAVIGLAILVRSR